MQREEDIRAGKIRVKNRRAELAKLQRDARRAEHCLEGLISGEMYLPEKWDKSPGNFGLLGSLHETATINVRAVEGNAFIVGRHGLGPVIYSGVELEKVGSKYFLTRPTLAWCSGMERWTNSEGREFECRQIPLKPATGHRHAVGGRGGNQAIHFMAIFARR
jgi:hypothetical protein